MFRDSLQSAGQIRRDSSSTALLDEPANPLDKISWVRDGNGPCFQFRNVVDVYAPALDVWRLVTNVNQFAQYSDGAVTAHMRGEFSPGTVVEMEIYKSSWIGKLIGKSNETITVIDNYRMFWGWGTRLPVGGETECYRLVEAITPSRTRVSIGLRIPGIIGFFTKASMTCVIQKAFRDLNNGIKIEAERQSAPSL